MKHDDICAILCKLKYCNDDFKTLQTSFIYEFGDRKYEVKFEREKGRVVNFQIKDTGEEVNEDN